jgi:hypothetical protein
VKDAGARQLLSAAGIRSLRGWSIRRGALRVKVPLGVLFMHATLE